MSEEDPGRELGPTEEHDEWMIVETDTAMRAAGIALPVEVLGDRDMCCVIDNVMRDAKDAKEILEEDGLATAVSGPTGLAFVVRKKIFVFDNDPEFIHTMYETAVDILEELRGGDNSDVASLAEVLGAYNEMRAEMDCVKYRIHEILIIIHPFPADMTSPIEMVHRFVVEEMFAEEQGAVLDKAQQAFNFIHDLVICDLAFTNGDENIWTSPEPWNNERTYYEVGERLARVILMGLRIAGHDRYEPEALSQEEIAEVLFWERDRPFTATWVQRGRELGPNGRILLLAFAQVLAMAYLADNPVQYEMFTRGTERIRTYMNPDRGVDMSTIMGEHVFRGLALHDVSSPAGEFLTAVACAVMDPDTVHELAMTVMTLMAQLWAGEQNHALAMAFIRLVSCRLFVPDQPNDALHPHPFYVLPDSSSSISTITSTSTYEDIRIRWPRYLDIQIPEIIIE